MAVLAPIFLDTTVFIAGILEMGEPSVASSLILDGVKAGRIPKAVTAWHCCLEFYAVATRLPGGLRLTPALAGQLVREEILGRVEVTQLPAAARGAFVSAAVGATVSGGRIYDAHIAECARLAGARIVVTDNRRHFVGLMRYGIRILTAVEFADEFGL